MRGNLSAIRASRKKPFTFRNEKGIDGLLAERRKGKDRKETAIEVGAL